MPALIDCHVCQGEGQVLQGVPGGYYSEADQCFYPLEQTVTCTECRGSGRIQQPPITLKAFKAPAVRSSDQIVAAICGVTPEELLTDEERAA